MGTSQPDNAHCNKCNEDYDKRELDAIIFHLGDHSPEVGATGIVGVRIYTYGFYLHAEDDAPPALRKLLTMIKTRYEENFSSDEFRQFRDSLSACGISLMEIERFNPVMPETVL